MPYLGDETDPSEIAQELVQNEVEKTLEEEGSFYILTDDEDNQFIIQEFKWEASEYVYMYHFVVERKDENGLYTVYDEQDVEENFADCQLVAGEYRYKIGLYNFLGIIELWTDWYAINVKKAIRPAITSVSPDFMYVDFGNDGKFTIKGKDISETASFKFTNIETGLELPAVVIDKDIARSVFNVQINGMSLEPGQYAVSARNEGGLTFSYSPITFAISRLVDFCISIRRSWAIHWDNEIIKNSWDWCDSNSGTSLFTLMEKLGFDSWKKVGFLNSVRDFFDQSALDARLTVLPLKKRAGYFGFSLDVSSFQAVNQTSEYKNTNYEIYANLSTAHLDFVYEHTLGMHFIFDVHAGAGASMCDIELKYSASSDTLKSIGLCLSAGLAFQWYPRRYFYMELGCDYNFNLFSGIKIHYVDPGFAMGFRF